MNPPGGGAPGCCGGMGCGTACVGGCSVIAGGGGTSTTVVVGGGADGTGGTGKQIQPRQTGGLGGVYTGGGPYGG